MLEQPNLKKGWLKEALEDAGKEYRRMPKHVCHECSGRKVKTYEVDNGGGWDRCFEEQPCRSCGGKGEVGGGQPKLEIFFQSKKQREEFKAKLLRMRGINWEDEGEVLEMLK